MAYRRLLYHPESNDLFEAYSEEEFRQPLETGQVGDVTNLRKFEELWHKMKRGKK